jgi:uncharacterized protein (UPF0297 family)
VREKMEVKHNMTDIRTKMKKKIKEQNQDQIKENLINVYNSMCEYNYRTLNLQLGNGYTLVVGIVEDRENKNDKVETDRH